MDKRFSFGFTLIELMVSLVLGLLVTGGVLGVFLANKQAYRQNENLARMQESARYAFELMARDLREAGGIACGSHLSINNVLNGASSSWWSNWGDGLGDSLLGFEGTDSSFPKAFGTGAADRVSGTDAVIVHSGTVNDGVYIKQHVPSSSTGYFEVVATADIAMGDILLVCDYEKAAIFQTTNVDIDNKIEYYCPPGGSVLPGNSSCLLSPSKFEKGGFISKLSANAWYVGYNGRGGRSLYRVKLQNNSGTAATTAEEIAEGVTDLQIQYLTRDPSGALASQYVDATAIPDYDGDGVADWNSVVAVKLEFAFQTLERVGTNAQAVERTWYTVVNLRNRMS